MDCFERSIRLEHRRRKAAAKCHIRLNLESFLPKIAVVETAKASDAKRAREVCSGIKEGEIALFDRAYVKYAHLFELEECGVFWVTRSKKGMAYKGIKKRLKKASKGILKDEEDQVYRQKGLKGLP